MTFFSYFSKSPPPPSLPFSISTNTIKSHNVEFFDILMLYYNRHNAPAISHVLMQNLTPLTNLTYITLVSCRCRRKNAHICYAKFSFIVISIKSNSSSCCNLSSFKFVCVNEKNKFLLYSHNVTKYLLRKDTYIIANYSALLKNYLSNFFFFMISLQ